MKATSREHLQQLIAQAMAKDGVHADVNHIDVSGITQMQALFYYDCVLDGQPVNLRYFKGDMSQWDVSNVTTMATMFRESHFKGDLSLWNVRNVQSMRSMFKDSVANIEMASWKTPCLTEASNMFENAKHVPDVSDWDTSSLVDAYGMFSRTKDAIDASRWNTAQLKTASCMFYLSAFNGDVSNWNTENLVTAVGMFSESQFAGDVSRWNTKRLEFAQQMFSRSPFDGDVSLWDVGAVQNFQGMFDNTPFSGDISTWDINKTAHIRDIVNSASRAKLPLHWPRSKIQQVFNTAAECHTWFKNSRNKGLASWEAAQGKVRPSWWTKEEYQALKFSRDTLVQLGVPWQEAVVQSWQQWYDATHRPVQDMGSSFDFATILAS